MDTKQENSRSEEKKEAIFGNWTAADSRLVIISGFSAFAANLLTVLVVVLAIVASRSALPHPLTTANLVFFWASSLIPAIALLFISAAWIRLKREKKNSGTLERVIMWTFIPLGIFEGFALLSYMLALIGIAAKISG